MNETEIIVTIILASVSFPFVLYLSVKLGTYGYFRGRDLYEKESEMARSRKASGRKKVSAKKWRSENRGGSIYLKLPEGVGTFQEKAETYRLDFMSYVVGKGNPRADDGEEYFERTFFVHQGIGPNQEWHLCLAKTFREACPVCEFRAKQMADPDGDEDLIKSLAPKERQLWLVRNMNEDPKQTLLWEISYHLFGKQLRDKINNADEDDGYDYFADPQEGSTVRVAFAQSDRGKWREAVDIEFRSREVQYDSDDVADMPCLDDLLVPTPYDKLKALFLQAETEDDDDDDDKATDREPTRKEKKERKTKPKTDVKIEVGGTVFWKGSPCEVLKIGGDDGEKLMVETMDGDVEKITVDDIDPEPPKEEKPEPKKKKKEKDDDDWFDDDKDDEKDEKDEKPEPKKKKKEKDDDDDDDWWGDD